MRSERALGTLSRVLRRLSFVGIAAGIAVSTMWHGCAGTNNDYMGNIVDGGTDDGPPPGSDLTCQKTPDPDVPDSSFVDNNCDGIDGDVNNAIFVSPVATIRLLEHEKTQSRPSPKASSSRSSRARPACTSTRAPTRAQC